MNVLLCTATTIRKSPAVGEASEHATPQPYFRGLILCRGPVVQISATCSCLSDSRWQRFSPSMTPDSLIE